MTELEVGTQAPDFTLMSHEGEQVSLAALRQEAEKGVIVYFYPKAATPGCTTQACDFRDNLASLEGAGYRVVGVSADPVEDLQSFAAQEQLTFPLLSDEGARVAREWGTWGEVTFNGKTFESVLRSTFVVAPDGTVAIAQYRVDAQGHVARLREELNG